MKLKIGEYQIAGDGMCVTIAKIGTSKEGKEYFSTVGHYSDIDQAFQRLLSEEITGSDITDIKSVLRAIKCARKAITEAARRVYLKKGEVAA